MGGIAHKLLCVSRVRFQWVHHAPSSLHTMQACLPIRPCPKLPKKLSRVSDGGGGGGASKASKQAKKQPPILVLRERAGEKRGGNISIVSPAATQPGKGESCCLFPLSPNGGALWGREGNAQRNDGGGGGGRG